MKKRYNKCVLLFLMLCVLLTACSGSGGSDSGFVSNSEIKSEVEGISMDNGVPSDSVNFDSGAGSSESGIEVEHNNSLVPDSTKLVYQCDISMETKDYANAKQKIKDLMKEYGCFIESEFESDDAYDWYESDYEKTSGTLELSLRLRVPSDKYSDFVSSIGEYGRVTSRSEHVSDITTDYYGTESMIESLKIQENRLLDMYNEAYTIEDMLNIEDRLTQVQAKIRQYQTQMNMYDLDIEYSIVTILLKEVMEYDYSNEETTFFSRLWDTIIETWSFTWKFLEWFLFFCIKMIPYLIVLLIITCIVRFIIHCNKNAENRRKNKNKDTKDAS